eukprot:185524-Rhodomonas_salina.1
MPALSSGEEGGGAYVACCKLLPQAATGSCYRKLLRKLLRYAATETHQLRALDLVVVLVFKLRLQRGVLLQHTHSQYCECVVADTQVVLAAVSRRPIR